MITRNIELDQNRYPEIAPGGSPPKGAGGTRPAPRRRYIANPRGTIFLYFQYYYFALFPGARKSKATANGIGRRFSPAQFWIKALFFVMFVIPATILLVVGLYYVKKSMGIDIFPGIHWPNIIDRFLRWL